MAQGMLPFFPGGVNQISDALAFKREDGRVVYFNYQMPIFIHDECDQATFRMITSQFCVNGNSKQADIIRAFGVTPISVKRGVKKYRSGGPAAAMISNRSEMPAAIANRRACRGGMAAGAVAGAITSRPPQPAGDSSSASGRWR